MACSRKMKLLYWYAFVLALLAQGLFSSNEVYAVAPTSSPTTSPTLHVNQNDVNAFYQLSVNLERANWKDCNSTNPDPCLVCSSNTNDHSVTCENIGLERRITGFKFRNLGIFGNTDSFVFFAFTALKSVDLSSDVAKPFVNQIVLPDGASCASASFCLRPNATCNFGPVVPVCDGSPTKSPTSAGPAPSNNDDIALYAGVSVAVFVLALLFFFGVYVYTRRLKQEEEQEERKLERRDSRRAMEEEQFQQQQMMMQQQYGGYPVAMGYPMNPILDVEKGRMSSSRDASTSGSGARRKSQSRKSFSSLRTRQKKSQAGPGPERNNSPAPAQEHWIQQLDAATGSPYWLNPATGMIRSDNPHQPRAGSSKDLRAAGSSRTLVTHGSSKSLKRSGSSKSLKSTSSQRRVPAGPPPGAPPHAAPYPHPSQQQFMQPQQMMVGGMPPPGMVGPPMAWSG